MDRDNTPLALNDLIAALADGELDLREHPEALALIAKDPQAAQRIACLQQLKQATGQAMDAPEMKCPDALAAKLRAMGVADVQAQGAQEASPTTRGYTGPPVIGRVGSFARWMPSAVAAVLLVAATVVFMLSSGNGPGASGSMSSLLTVSQVNQFDKRHDACAAKPDILKNNKDFGAANDLTELPGKLGSYFKTSTNGMTLDLSAIGYQYELTGACSLPGSGAVHIVYHHNETPDRSISLWLSPDDGRLDSLEKDRVYVEAGKTLDRPVIVWRGGGMIYYLVGDSLQDAHQAVQVLHPPA